MDPVTWSLSIRRDSAVDPLPVRAHAGVDPILEFARATIAERHHADQHRSIGGPPHQRATTIALAGIDTTLFFARAHHALPDGAVVGGRVIARRRVHVRHSGLLQVLGAGAVLCGRAPPSYLERLPDLHRRRG